MKRIHIIGRKNHGKTQLVVDLVQAFGQRGLRVGTIKHTHHKHELDTPGKDSHRHRMAGADVVGIASRSMSAVFIPHEEACSRGDRYELMSPMFQGCDLLLVEGDSQASAIKLEVWRAGLGSDPMSLADSSISAIVSDDRPPTTIPNFPRSDLTRLIDWIFSSL